MRALLALSLLFLSLGANAAIFPEADATVTEVPSGRPGVYKFVIKENADANGQAAVYTSPNLAELYQRAITEYMPLKSKVEAVYAANGCKPDGTMEGENDGLFCGQLNGLEEDNTVPWTFGRGGWAEAEASYKSILTFTGAGSGRYTEPALEILTYVGVSATNTPNENTPAVFEVTIDMTAISNIHAR